MAVIASFSSKVAVPNEAGRGAPVVSVGTTGGFSAAFDIVARRIVAACDGLLESSIRTGSIRTLERMRIFLSFENG
jgi:hypothetical protein